jgi:hypothetical protein
MRKHRCRPHVPHALYMGPAVWLQGEGEKKTGRKYAVADAKITVQKRRNEATLLSTTRSPNSNSNFMLFPLDNDGSSQVGVMAANYSIDTLGLGNPRKTLEALLARNSKFRNSLVCHSLYWEPMESTFR